MGIIGLSHSEAGFDLAAGWNIPGRLLHDMGQFVGQQPVPVPGAGPVIPLTEEDVRTCGQGLGLERSGDLIGLGACMDPNCSQVGPKGRLKMVPGMVRQPGTALPGMSYGRTKPGMGRTTFGRPQVAACLQVHGHTSLCCMALRQWVMRMLPGMPGNGEFVRVECAQVHDGPPIWAS